VIAYLEGSLADKKPTSTVIDVKGVGYAVFIPLSTYQKLPEIGDTIRLLTYTYVREDSFTLYGFLTAQEKQLFELLLGVNGIGPKSALGVLSSISVDQFESCILQENLSMLTKISGIGRKTAQRLVVELKERLQKISGKSDKTGGLPHGETFQEALGALLTLGYDRREAESALGRLKAEDRGFTSEDMVKRALNQKLSAQDTVH
jgi:Holliday junction DNA helicase RuvA